MILKIYTSHHRKACTKNACFFEKLVHGNPKKKGHKKHTAKQIVRAFKKKAIKEKKQKKN